MNRIQILGKIRAAIAAGKTDVDSVLDHVVSSEPAGAVDWDKWLPIIIKLIELLLPLLKKQS